MIKSVIIEDETKTREGLEHLLHKYCPEISICGMADDFEQGYRLIKQENPSLVFIDIQLNSLEGTGVELIQALQLTDCAVIFISGYKDYAVEAFRLKAVDYLLKPIRINHLVEAVEKAKKYLDHLKASDPGAGLKSKNEIFHIHSQNGFVLVRQQDIVRCEADGAYTHFYVSGKTEKITSSLNIGQIEQKLGADFLRVHKSHIINKVYIVSYSKGEGLLVKMPDQSEIPVSRTQKDQFFKWLG
jgi:two-component system LytT family response regulator